jgi:hypothetical protein
MHKPLLHQCQQTTLHAACIHAKGQIGWVSPEAAVGLCDPCACPYSHTLVGAVVVSKKGVIGGLAKLMFTASNASVFPCLPKSSAPTPPKAACVCA